VEVLGPEGIGDYLEFGVSRGTSMACVSRVLRQLHLDHVRLIGFDSFLGLPSDADGGDWAEGVYRSTVGATRRYLKRGGVKLDRVILVRGWFNDTLNDETRRRHGIGKASLIMIDCSIYSSSKEALTFCEPHIHDRTILIFDDWGWKSNVGEIGQKEAFEEFLADQPSLTATPLPAYTPEARMFLIERGSA